MNKIVGIAIQLTCIFFGICLILLGLIFLISGTLANLAIGGVMILIAIGLFIFVYVVQRIRSKQATLVNQTVNVTMGGSGEFKEKKIKCPSCSAPVEDKDLKMIDGGIMVKCPYCGSMSALQEEPKW